MRIFDFDIQNLPHATYTEKGHSVNEIRVFKLTARESEAVDNHDQWEMQLFDGGATPAHRELEVEISPHPLCGLRYLLWVI